MLLGAKKSPPECCSEDYWSIRLVGEIRGEVGKMNEHYSRQVSPLSTFSMRSEATDDDLM